MQTFKQFLEAKKVPVPVADYYPNHGSHAQEKKKVPVADYTPSHGKHSMKEETQKEMSHEEFVSHNPNSKIHPRVSGVHALIDAPEDKYKRSLKTHEKDAVGEYTGSSASTNRELIDTAHGRPSNFEHHPDDDSWTTNWKNGAKQRHEKTMKGLDSILNRSKVPRNLTVFHGINAVSSEKFNPGELASQHPERHVRMPAYLSTSIDPSISAYFAKPEKYNDKDQRVPTTTHMLRIHLKRGQKGFRYIGSNSSISSEREGILKRNSTLKIGEHPTVVHHPETGGQIHVWDAHVVD
jgi:hypothetical protein